MLVKGLLYLAKQEVKNPDHGIVGGTFSMKLQAGGTDWATDLRKYFKPYEEAKWTPMHASCPDIDHPSLIFPWYIEAGEGSRWALLVRKEAMRKGRKNMWKFVLLDPAGGEDTAEAIASLINERTTLAQELEELDNDETGDGGRVDHRCTIERLDCPQLQGCEDGHRMILHLSLALGATLEELKAELGKLRQLEDLESETRYFIKGVVTGSMRLLTD